MPMPASRITLIIAIATARWRGNNPSEAGDKIYVLG